MNYTDWYYKNGKLGDQVWIQQNLILETIIGSHAYGCHTPSSDYDILGIVIPEHKCIIPQHYGYILGFDQIPTFKRKEMKGPAKRMIIGKKEVEIEWISIVDFFYNAGIKGSPNLLECLFTKRNQVTFGTKHGFYLRDIRKEFLSLKTYYVFRGYAYSQIYRIKNKNPETEKRKNIVKKYQYDIKMAYHVIRLIDQTEQILREGDIDLHRSKEECQLMRDGKWGNFEKFEKVCDERMNNLEKLVAKTSLPVNPRFDKLRTVLSTILDKYYGSNKTQQTEYISTKDVNDKLDRLISYFNNHFIGDGK